MEVFLSPFQFRDKHWLYLTSKRTPALKFTPIHA
jgi:hypothetical protein